MFGRALMGAGAGFMMTGNVGGAIGGGLAGAFGPGIGKRMLQKRGNVSGMAKSGLTTLGRMGPQPGSIFGTAKSMGMKGRYGYPQAMKKSTGTLTGIRGTKDKGALPDTFSHSFQRNISQAGSYIGRNEVNVNKMGGYTLGAMGMMAASNIGSSAISSNRGY
jgi:hypothetical protein